MLFFYIRHGDPIYTPDSLTPLGHRQAEAVAKRLAIHGIDRIFASTSTRAQLTAQPTCEITKKEMQLADFANEHHAWEELTYDSSIGKRWLFHAPEVRKLFVQPELLSLGQEWYTHPMLASYHYEKGLSRIQSESDKFFAALGYEHIPGTGAYRVTKTNNERVAMFAHQGFGLSFLSCILDIPYPQFTLHFDFCHTGMTVIDFKEEDGIAIPRILTLSSDSHLYKEGLPTFYNHEMRF